MLTDRIKLFLLGTVALLLLLGLATLLWRRYYREDPHNTARRVVKNSAIPLVLRLLVRALDLLFAFVLLDTLRGADIGPYTFAALFVVQILGTFTEFGLGVLLTREVARDAGAAQRYFGVTLALRAVLVLVGALPVAALLIGVYGLLAALNLGEAISPVGQQAIWILVLTLVPGAYSSAVTALYNAAERMEVPAVVEVVTAIVSMLVRLAVLALGFGIIGLAWAAVGVSTFTALVYLVLQSRDFFRPTISWDRALIRTLLPLALPLMLNNLLNAVFFRFDTFIIKAFATGSGDLLVQQYNLAYQIIGIATILPPVVTFAVFPVLSRRADGERSGLALAQNRTLQALLLLAFPISVGLMILAPDLIRLFARRNAGDYLPASANALAILAWFLPLSFANGLLQYVLIAVNQQRAITRAFVVGAAFNLLANLAAVPWFSRYLMLPELSLYAASVITLLSEVVLLLVFLPILRREQLAPPLLTLAWRPAVASLPMGAAMLAIRGFEPQAPLLALAAALAAPPIYLLALWLVGAFGAEERALMRRVLGRT
ncbi:MAG TPA: oligosaccharide flippase family protein [Roseiflexaceae bacterium]|nr:oligosaccharide flippase family protein [Roseiflexaceae bacterium]